MTNKLDLPQFSDLDSYTPKRLRTLRNNLNNRISQFKAQGMKAKELSKSHRLYGLNEVQCETLLKSVQAKLSALK